jgi:hypothetical protein
MNSQREIKDYAIFVSVVVTITIICFVLVKNTNPPAEKQLKRITKNIEKVEIKIFRNLQHLKLVPDSLLKDLNQNSDRVKALKNERIWLKKEILNGQRVKKVSAFNPKFSRYLEINDRIKKIEKGVVDPMKRDFALEHGIKHLLKDENLKSNWKRLEVLNQQRKELLIRNSNYYQSNKIFWYPIVNGILKIVFYIGTFASILLTIGFVMTIIDQ